MWMVLSFEWNIKKKILNSHSYTDICLLIMFMKCLQFMTFWCTKKRNIQHNTPYTFVSFGIPIFLVSANRHASVNRNMNYDQTIWTMHRKSKLIYIYTRMQWKLAKTVWVENRSCIIFRILKCNDRLEIIEPLQFCYSCTLKLTLEEKKYSNQWKHS